MHLKLRKQKKLELIILKDLKETFGREQSASTTTLPLFSLDPKENELDPDYKSNFKNYSIKNRVNINLILS